MATTASRPRTLKSKLGDAAGPLMLLVGIIGVVTALAITNRGGTENVVVSQNPAIESLTPADGAEVLRQSEVGIDLVSGYEAELIINGVFIPPGELNIFRDIDNPEISAEQAGTFDSTLNRFVYQPLEGRVIPELKGDENCATANFWPLSDPSARQSVSWCFTVA